MADRLTTPRIAPLTEDERTPRQQQVIDDLVVGPTQNIYKTLARHPDYAEAMVNLGRTLRSGELDIRHRETVILRMGWNCQSAYEFAQHRRLALGAGMTIDDIRRIQLGPDAPDWDPVERLLCIAADELHTNQIIGDETWAALVAHFDERSLVEIIGLAGYYTLVCFQLNSLGVPIEGDAPSFVTDDE
jgi:alkylhydroperoxidase family enzyme